MNYSIRAIRQTEYPLLQDFLYEAIFVPEGTVPPDRSILLLPELQVYIADFGQHKDDLCFIAEVADQVAGAVWVRDMPDYGHVADGIPSFAISLYPQYRGRGIGTALMRHMLAALKQRGYQKASLSVQKANAAVRMYLRLGFEILEDHGEEYLMLYHL